MIDKDVGEMEGLYEDGGYGEPSVFQDDDSDPDGEGEPRRDFEDDDSDGSY